MVLGRLLHKEGPMYNKVFCLPCVSLAKRMLKLCKTISFESSTVWSEFPDFIQIKRTVFIEKIESYCIHALVDSFFNRQLIYRSKLHKRYMLHFM